MEEIPKKAKKEKYIISDMKIDIDILRIKG
jgi:hypothetical protein